jgi:hypothetical protein
MEEMVERVRDWVQRIEADPQAVSVVLAEMKEWVTEARGGVGDLSPREPLG